MMPAEGSEILAVKELLVSATNGSPRILNATLAPVIIFFARQNQRLSTKDANSFTSCTLHASGF